MHAHNVRANDAPARETIPWLGLDIAVEVRGGETRHPGSEFEVALPREWVGYGYFENVDAPDGDSLDVLIGPMFYEDHNGPDVAYVAEQLHAETGEYQQDKVLLGFTNEEAARAAFLVMWPEKMFGGIREVPVHSLAESIKETAMETEARVAAPTKLRERTEYDHVCPHCDEVIHEKGIFSPDRGATIQHRVCGGAITFTRTAAKPKYCSHCGKEITANELFGRDDRWFHRPCISKGPIALEKKGEELTRGQYRTLVHRSVKAKELGEIEGYTVWRVDGTWIRDNVDVDFVAGGNCARYKYVPDGEVWVENGLSDKDTAATIVHEVVECDAMLDGQSYEDAHAFAGKIERVFRDQYDGGNAFRAAEKFLMSGVDEEEPELEPQPGEEMRVAFEVTAADIGGLQLRRKGYQRYVAEHVDEEGTKHKVWIGGESKVEHGSYGGNSRQRRKTTWVVKIDGEEVGEEKTLKGARELAEGKLGIVKPVAPVAPAVGAPAAGPVEVSVADVLAAPEMGPDPLAALRIEGAGRRRLKPQFRTWEPGTPAPYPTRGPKPRLVKPPTGRDPELGPPAEPMHIVPDEQPPAPPVEVSMMDLSTPERAPSEWLEPEPPRPAPLTEDPEFDPRLHVAPEFAKPPKSTDTGPRGPLPPLAPSPALSEEEEAAELERKRKRDEAAVSPEAFKRAYEALKIKPNKKPGDGFQNIINVLKAADPKEIEFYAKWYDHAHDDIAALAKRYRKPIPVVAGIVAVLSPGMNWNKNLELAERILQGQTRSSAWPENVAKARHILRYGDLSVLTEGAWGPKVGPFFESIASPASQRRRVVIDGHAINIWRGKYEPLQTGWISETKKQRSKGINISDAERAAAINDYQRAGDAFGLTPQATQAITWTVWRELVERHRAEQKAKERAKQKKKTGGLIVPLSSMLELGPRALRRLADCGWQFPVDGEIVRRFRADLAPEQLEAYEREWQEPRSLESVLEEVEFLIKMRGPVPELLRVRDRLRALVMPRVATVEVTADELDKHGITPRAKDAPREWHDVPAPEPKRDPTLLRPPGTRPRKKGPPSIMLKPNGGYQNIMKVLALADDAEKDYWGRWYSYAHSIAQEMAGRHGLPFEVVAGVIAVLSPGNKWHQNVAVAKQVIDWWKARQEFGPHQPQYSLIGPPQVPGKEVEPEYFDEESLEEFEYDENEDELRVAQRHRAPAKPKAPKKPTKRPYDFKFEKTPVEYGEDDLVESIGGEEDLEALPIVERKPVAPLGFFGPKPSGYPLNIQKAVRILNGEAPDEVITGPKVTVFYQTILNPERASKPVLDGHAINIWRGEKKPLKGLRQPTIEEREAIERDYARVAAETGLTVHGAQAITWFIWKSIQNQPKTASYSGSPTEARAMQSRGYSHIALVYGASTPLYLRPGQAEVLVAQYGDDVQVRSLDEYLGGGAPNVVEVTAPTWYLKEGSNVAFTAAYGVEGREVKLAPGARVLDLSEDTLRKSAAADPGAAELVTSDTTTKNHVYCFINED